MGMGPFTGPREYSRIIPDLVYFFEDNCLPKTERQQTIWIADHMMMVSQKAKKMFDIVQQLLWHVPFFSLKTGRKLILGQACYKCHLDGEKPEYRLWNVFITENNSNYTMIVIHVLCTLLNTSTRRFFPSLNRTSLSKSFTTGANFGS